MRKQSVNNFVRAADVHSFKIRVFFVGEKERKFVSWQEFLRVALESKYLCVNRRTSRSRSSWFSSYSVLEIWSLKKPTSSNTQTINSLLLSARVHVHFYFAPVAVEGSALSSEGFQHNADHVITHFGDEPEKNPVSVSLYSVSVGVHCSTSTDSIHCRVYLY